MTLPSDTSVQAARGLAEVLTGIVGDSTRLESLYEVLGPFCHQSRNILNSLKMSLYLLRRKEECLCGGDWEVVERIYSELERMYDQLQTICRPMLLALVKMSLSLLIEDRRRSWVADFAAYERSLELIAPVKGDVGHYDPNCLGQALDTFVAWRAESGEKGTSATLRWWTERGKFHVEWVESDAELPSRESGAPDRSESLALPLLGRVISAHGGALHLVKPRGRHVRLSWPQVARPPL